MAEKVHCDLCGAVWGSVRMNRYRVQQQKRESIWDGLPSWRWVHADICGNCGDTLWEARQKAEQEAKVSRATEGE